MNRPSLEKFVDKVVPGGTILVDSSMIDIKVERTDVNVYYVDATKIADENNMHSCAIIILVGKMFKELGFCSKEALDGAIQKVIPPKKAAMLELNQKALEIGQQA
jgi:2-oxoglutarate ferredoxin oxidoreductase subunit gamma